MAERNGRVEELIGEIGYRDRIINELTRTVAERRRSSSSQIVRTIYRRTPLPFFLKVRIKEGLFRSTPFLFKHTVAYQNWLTSNSAHHHYSDRNRSIASRVDEINSKFTKTGNICVVLHLYYEDVAERIVSQYLEPVRDDVDVFVTTHDKISMKMLDYLEERQPGLYVMLSENRGRDIRPFLQILPLLLDNGYEIACKIHTKKSAHRFDGDDQCTRSLESLLNPSRSIQEIVRLFSQNERLGMITPPHTLLPLANPRFHEDNVYWLDKLLIRMGEADQVGKYAFYFPAGSMYWFRVRALAKLADEGFIGLDEFEPETGELVEALQHSIERIISLLVEKAGFESTIVPHHPGLSLSTETPPQ